jgi:Domain of unknown function (DUF4157)
MAEVLQAERPKSRARAPAERARSNGGTKAAGAAPPALPGYLGGTAGATASTDLAPYLQTQLAISQPGDPAERQAEQTARAVVQSLQPGATPSQDVAGAPVRLSRQAALSDGGPRTHATAPADMAQRMDLRQASGAGRPIPVALRRPLETRFAADLSDVRLHVDEEADAMCRRVHAHAFTVGSDIYFAAGAYDPSSDEGLERLAHELTHVMQQTAGSPQLQRDGTAGATGGAADGDDAGGQFTLSDGTFIDRNRSTFPGSPTPRKRIDLPHLSLPDFKARNRRRFPTVLAVRPGARRDSSVDDDGESVHYRDMWKNGLRPRITELLNPRLEAARIAGGVHRDTDTYFFRSRQNREQTLFGTPAQLIESHLLPFWSTEGQPTAYQVDHVVESQLINPDDTSLNPMGDPNEVSNLELLEAAANGSAGRRLDAQITRRLREAVRLFGAEHPAERPLTLEGLRRGYYINFLHHDFELSGIGGQPGNYWTFGQVHRGQALTQMEPLTGDQMRRLGRDDTPVVFTSPMGGAARPIERSRLPIRNWLPRVNLTGLEMNATPTGDEAGWIEVDAFNAEDARAGAVTATYPQMRWRLKPVPGIYGGAIDAEQVKQDYFGARTSLQLPGMSPLSFDSLSIDAQGLQAAGRVLPTVPLLRDADIRLRLRGGAVELYKTFTLGELALPAPLALTECSLTVFFGSERGLGVEGRADFEIRRLGRGYLEAAAASRGGFELTGGFDFDSELFDRAHIEAWYRAGEFGAAGELAITTPNRVRGIRAASLQVRYDAGAIRAEGSVQPSIPGVQEAGLTVAYSEAEGLTIGGTLALAENRAIRSGSIDVTLRKPDDRWRVQANGRAVPAIPGLDSELEVHYDDGAFDARFAGTFRRGMLAGSVEVGATNRTLDEAGQPTGPAADDAPIIVYGSGSATVQLAPWLQGTAGLRFAPDGEVTVRGEIGLPSSLSLFDRRQIDRQLFGLSVQVPIVPGIVAEVGGNLSATAGIGPGQLDQLRIGIEYTPSREQDTHVTGDAHLSVPADAGLRLAARAGIGLGITGASATGGIELGGTAGITGAAEAGVHIDWRPSTGLSIEAEGYLHAEPRFRFDVSGYVSVQALGFSVYDERYELAAFELGSNLRLGVRFPVRYREGQPFDVSLDDVVFEVPPVDPMALVQDVIGQVA